jgi:hypothetical protein
MCLGDALWEMRCGRCAVGDALWELHWDSRSEVRRVFIAEKGDCFPWSSGSSGTTNAVDVALYGLGEVCARAINTVSRIRDGWVATKPCVPMCRSTHRS